MNRVLAVALFVLAAGLGGGADARSAALGGAAADRMLKPGIRLNVRPPIPLVVMVGSAAVSESAAHAQTGDGRGVAEPAGEPDAKDEIIQEAYPQRSSIVKSEPLAHPRVTPELIRQIFNESTDED